MNLAFLRRFLPFTHGLPSHHALCDLFNALDHGAFRDAFIAWAESLRTAGVCPSGQEIVAVDGKAS